MAKDKFKKEDLKPKGMDKIPMKKKKLPVTLDPVKVPGNADAGGYKFGDYWNMFKAWLTYGTLVVMGVEKPFPYRLILILICIIVVGLIILKVF
ncbi:MAG: hypothetical protein A2V66_03700 [Ignavibacteria bacterium RBG_13_36_8]|nr:MAG: hypothetical protein A2V66_03700 [Ignavibacteria bacterium RBG_13_36_8]